MSDRAANLRQRGCSSKMKPKADSGPWLSAWCVGCSLESKWRNEFESICLSMSLILELKIILLIAL